MHNIQLDIIIEGMTMYVRKENIIVNIQCINFQLQK